MGRMQVRVTQLEAFRRFVSDEYEYVTEQSVIDSITGTFEGNEMTRVGTAFHRIVEQGAPLCAKVPEGERTFLYYGSHKSEPVPCGRVFDVDGHSVTLDIAQCKTALGYRNEHPHAFHEIRKYVDFGDGVTVTGCADMIDGIEIRDIKTKFSAPNDADYTSSAQWRFYLQMFGADTFHFDLFVFDGYSKDKHGHDVRGLPLRRHLPPITCHRYNGMEQDNRYLLGEFVRWAGYRKLTDYLKPKEI